MTQEDCEERGYNWTEAPDREGEYYCDFEVEENREITREDCERRNGTWTDAPDRPEEVYCDFDGDGSDDNSTNNTETEDPVDSDQDGVADEDDAFPNDANETADSDGDGVGDNADQCDDTESGATIGEDGCEEAEPQVHFIDISGMAFSPSTLTISVGDTITWTNQDSAPHSATGDNGEFDSGTLSNGQTFSFTFTTTGTYTYHCAIHNGMTATIIVE